MLFKNILFFSVALASVVTPSKKGNGLKLDFDVVQGSNLRKYKRADLIKKRTNLIKRADGSESLEIDQMSSGYQAVVYMGSNRDECMVLLDTGSSDLWVMGSDLKCAVDVSNQKRDEPEFEQKAVANATGDVIGAIPSGDPYSSVAASECTALGSFNTAASTSFKKNDTAPPFYDYYEDNSFALGVYGSDTVGFSNTQVNMTFGVVNASSTNQGILGIGPILSEANFLGYPDYYYPNFPVQLKNQGLIEKMAYSLFLNKQESKKGSVLFGAVDHKKYSGQLQTVPVVNLYRNLTRYDSFAVKIDQIYFETDSQNVTILDQPMGAVLDSGTSWQSLPQPVVSAMVSSMSGNYSEEQSLYQVDCVYLHDSSKLVYDFSGVQIKVPMSEMVTEIDGSCYLTVSVFEQSSSTFANAILGDTFLRSAYVVYDLEDLEISLAQASYTDEEKVEVISGSVPSAVKAPGYSSTSLAVSLSEDSTAQLNPSSSKTSGGNKGAVSIAFVLAMVVLGAGIN